MFDESIGSSPQKHNRSIHKVRQQRKSERRKLEEPMVFDSVAPLPQLDGQKESIQCEGATIHTLHELYETATADKLDDTLCASPPTQRYGLPTNFDPFAEERLLILADRVQQPDRRNVKLIPTQSFQKCAIAFSETMELEAETEIPNDAGATKSNVAVGAKTQFGITESELLHFCDETEKRVVAKDIRKSPTFKQLQTPQTSRPKSIVEMILEDFNSSPASPEMHLSEESPFVFKFANEPLRTYSRREGREHVVARQNISSQLESVAIAAIDDDVQSNGSSSGLSVQEGISQEPTDTATYANLHNSQILCENLQNLSTYFMKLTEEGETRLEPAECDTVEEDSDSTKLYITAIEEQDSADSALKNVNFEAIDKQQVSENDETIIERNVQLSSVMQEIMTWREEHPVVFNPNSSSSTSGFCGFSTEKEVSMKTENRIDVEHSTTNKYILAKSNVAMTSSTNECDIQTKTEMRESDVTNIFMDDANEWNDECDFFANFSTQDLLKTEKLNEKKPCDKHCKTKENSAVPISNTEKEVAELQFVGFRTASKKSIQISKEAQLRAASILQEVSGFEVLESQEKNKQVDTDTAAETENAPHEKISTASIENVAFIGFRTASSKVIQVSKEAQARAAKILEQLPDLPAAVGTIESAMMSHDKVCNSILPTRKCTTVAAAATNKLASLHSFEDIRTTSRKNTADSKTPTTDSLHKLNDSQLVENENHNPEIEENLANIQFSEWCLDDVEAVKDSVPNKQKIEEKQQVTSLPGFATASKKSIKISEAAKKRAASILAELPELPKLQMGKQADPIKHSNEPNATSGTNASMCDELNDFVFSEWPLPEDTTQIKKVEEKNVIATARKRMLEYTNSNPPTDVIAPTHAAKKLCKSDSMSKISTINRTPLNKIENAAICASLSDMATQTPLNAHTSRTVISRKNLLSLSRRNKSTRRTSYDDRHSVETPTKRSVGAAIAEEQYHVLQTSPGTPMPNLKEFFDSIAQNTSTPHPAEPKVRTRLRKCTLPKDEQSTAAELKPIEWESENYNLHNKSNSSVKTPERNVSIHSNDDNVTQMDINPTAKQRIERLKMYGKPPNVSPIYMSNKNNCRPSGLRRRDRSLVKQ